MTKIELTSIAQAVADDVQSQYPKVDYLNKVVAISVQKHLAGGLAAMRERAEKAEGLNFQLGKMLAGWQERALEAESSLANSRADADAMQTRLAALERCVNAVITWLEQNGHAEHADQHAESLHKKCFACGIAKMCRESITPKGADHVL